MSVLVTRITRPFIKKQAVKAGEALADYLGATGEARNRIVRRTAKVVASSSSLVIAILTTAMTGDGTGVVDTLLDALSSIDAGDVADSVFTAPVSGGDFEKCVNAVTRLVNFAEDAVDTTTAWHEAGRAADTVTTESKGRPQLPQAQEKPEDLPESMLGEWRGKGDDGFHGPFKVILILRPGREGECIGSLRVPKFGCVYDVKLISVEPGLILTQIQAESGKCANGVARFKLKPKGLKFRATPPRGGPWAMSGHLRKR